MIIVVIRRKRRLSVHESKTGLIRRRQRPNTYVLDKGYNSEQEEQKLIKRGDMSYTYQSRKKKKKGGGKYDKSKRQQKRYQIIKNILLKDGLSREQTPGITDLENYLLAMRKKSENYLGLVQFSCCIIIFRKIILG